MALNFPNSPAVGQVHNDQGGSWTWNGTAWVSGTTPSQMNGLPIGSLIWIAGKRVPNGFVTANGAPVLPLYKTLRDMLIADGNPFGTNGTDPLLPNLVNKTAFGSGGLYTVGQTGGAATVALTEANLPAHTHPFSGTTGLQNANHTHVTQPIYRLGTGNAGTTGDAIAGMPAGASPPSIYAAMPAVRSGNEEQNHGHAFSGTTNPTGSGTAHENMPPFVAMLPCVKAYDALNVTGVLNADFATQAEAIAGTATDKLMSPARATDHLTARYATEAEAIAGAVTNKLMSPALVRAAREKAPIKAVYAADAALVTLTNTFAVVAFTQNITARGSTALIDCTCNGNQDGVGVEQMICYAELLEDNVGIFTGGLTPAHTSNWPSALGGAYFLSGSSSVAVTPGKNYYARLFSRRGFAVGVKVGNRSVRLAVV